MKKTYLLVIGTDKYVIKTHLSLGNTLYTNVKFFCDLPLSIAEIQKRLQRVKCSEYVSRTALYYDLDEERERLVYGFLASIGSVPFSYNFRTMDLDNEIKCNFVVLAPVDMKKEEIANWYAEYGVVYDARIGIKVKVTDYTSEAEDGVYNVTVSFTSVAGQEAHYL